MTAMELLTIPGLDNSKKLENVRKDSMEKAVSELGQDEKGSNIGKQEALDKRSEELLAAVDILDAASEDELESAGIILSSESKSVSFSGLLPHPDVHKLYDPETRELNMQME